MNVSPEIEAEMMRLIREMRTVTAIKALRAATGCGLKEAHDWVNEKYDQMLLELYPPQVVPNRPYPADRK